MIWKHSEIPSSEYQQAYVSHYVHAVKINDNFFWKKTWAELFVM